MTTPLTYSITEAAARLGGPFTVDWLRGHLAEIPHIKNGSGRGRGGRIGFSELHLAQIVAQFSVEPDTTAPIEPRYASAVTRRRRAS